MSDDIRSRTQPRRDRGWLLVLFVYCSVYGALLVCARGLPYSVDNNESFSSLWHARNLFTVPFGQTKGLADEVFAWHRSASPEVHTHQGNFPRLFSFFLYLIGFRTIASQILITTFTAGLASLWFAYQFLRRSVSLPFAVVACCVLITDYALFGQWQLNTYRLWYGFFAFAALWWIETLPSRRSTTNFLLGSTLFACIFYGEYVFAAFVAISTACYAIYRCWDRRDCLLPALIAVMSGTASAAFVLVCQLLAYMGWPNLLQDIHYTLAARNMAADPVFAAKVARFYSEHHIIFWQNYYDTGGLKTLSAMWGGIERLHLAFYSPWLFFVGITLAGGAFIGSWLPSGGRIARAARIGVFGVFLCLLIRQLPILSATFIDLWSGMRGMPFLLLGGPPALFIASAVGAFLVNGWPTTGLDARASQRIAAVLTSVLFGFACVYRVFTGYIYSGYLNRQAPFLVFWTDILVALGLFILGSLAYSGLKGLATVGFNGRRSAALDQKPDFISFPARSVRRLLAQGVLAFASGALLLYLIAAWAILQFGYFQASPPTNYRFLRLLSRPPFVRSTFIANNYPAPIAEMTRTWAYNDGAPFSGLVQLGPDGFKVSHNANYLWFADAATNTEYLRPQYGLIIRQPANLAESLRRYLEPLPTARSPADTFGGIVARCSNPIQGILQDKLMATDGRNFAIIKFDWDYPPFLALLGKTDTESIRSLPLADRIRISESADDLSRLCRIELAPEITPDPEAAAPPRIDIVSVDGRPLLSSCRLLSPISLVCTGKRLLLQFAESPNSQELALSINNSRTTLKLAGRPGSHLTVVLNADRPFGRFTLLPRFTPGMYVKANDAWSPHGDFATVRYRFRQQQSLPEADTTIRLYTRTTGGSWSMLDAVTYLGATGLPVRLEEFCRRNPDFPAEYTRVRKLGDGRTFAAWLADALAAEPANFTRPGILRDLQQGVDGERSADGGVFTERTFPMPLIQNGVFRISVSPGTRSKQGPEYFSQEFTSRTTATRGEKMPDFPTITGNAAATRVSYGRLRLIVKFPIKSIGQAEPIISTGYEEAGDFLYVIYVDASHIRIGYDHWFEGGPVTPPLPIDYSTAHQIDVSMGSLFPPVDDVLFSQIPASECHREKDRISVILDGKTVIDSSAGYYDSPPSQVTVGRNTIHGTTSDPEFTGTILSQKRLWPELQ